MIFFNTGCKKQSVINTIQESVPTKDRTAYCKTTLWDTVPMERWSVDILGPMRFAPINNMYLNGWAIISQNVAIHGGMKSITIV